MSKYVQFFTRLQRPSVLYSIFAAMLLVPIIMTGLQMHFKKGAFHETSSQNGSVIGFETGQSRAPSVALQAQLSSLEEISGAFNEKPTLSGAEQISACIEGVTGKLAAAPAVQEPQVASNVQRLIAVMQSFNKRLLAMAEGATPTDRARIDLVRRAVESSLAQLMRLGFSDLTSQTPDVASEFRH